MDRRRFLQALGLTGGALATMGVAELEDRLQFARAPTSSIYLPRERGFGLIWTDAVWERAFYLEAQRNTPFVRYLGSCLDSAPSAGESL